MRDAVRPRVPLPPVRHEARHRHGPARGGPPRPGRDAEALRVLPRAARVLLEDLPDLTDRLLAVLSEEEPAYRALLESDPGPTWQEVRRSLRHSVGSLLDPRACRDAARRCSWQIGGTRAEQGMPLDALLHAFRLGGSLVWQALVDETSRIAPDEVRLLVHVAGDVWSFVDEHCTLVADAYRQVERQLTWRHENRLRLMTAALLDGSTRIADLPEVAAALDLPERGRYAVVAVASAHAAAYGAGHPVPPPPGMRVRWHVGTDTEYGIVLVGDGDPAALAREPQAPPGTRTGVSSVVDGLAAVGDARRLAETALR
ncbi:PucR family transcriptional regulator, partial [Streptomyces sp. CC77]|uniref:PucR family transcriptional regulator n=1 Tax=Streptomyces sp. CC77 TaxID=1906739 RepID=UPI0009A10B7B